MALIPSNAHVAFMEKVVMPAKACSSLRPLAAAFREQFVNQF